MSDRKVTEARLEESLQRLLNNSPIRTKLGGRLSLNKINNEAGLGHSYVHKFPVFVTRATLLINEYNKNRESSTNDLQLNQSDLTDIEKLKIDLKKEKSLKAKYRKERDDAIEKQKNLEGLNSTLMFRLYELQAEVRKDNIVTIPRNKR